MNRIEFMSELAVLLQAVPEEERKDAMQYYNDYFDDAGEEKEQEVIAKLESPKKVADKIKADILEQQEEETREKRCPEPYKVAEYEYTDSSVQDKKPWSSNALKIILIIAIILVGGCAAALALGVTVKNIESHYPNGITIFSDDDDDYDDYDDDSENDADDHHDDDSHDNSTVSGNQANEEGEVYSGITSIDGNISAGEVEICVMPELSNEIKIVTENIDERLNLKYYKEGSEFKITTNQKITGITGGEKVGKVSIYVPSGYTFEEVSLDMKAGTLYIEDIQTRELSVDIGAGKADVEHFQANEAEFDCGTGAITAVGIADVEADLDCGVGKISYTTMGKESDYNYEINCGIGEIICGSTSYSGLGKEKKIHNNAAKEMNIDCGVGAVTVKFVEQL